MLTFVIRLWLSVFIMLSLVLLTNDWLTGHCFGVFQSLSKQRNWFHVLIVEWWVMFLTPSIIIIHHLHLHLHVFFVLCWVRSGDHVANAEGPAVEQGRECRVCHLWPQSTDPCSPPASDPNHAEGHLADWEHLQQLQWVLSYGCFLDVKCFVTGKCHCRPNSTLWFEYL